MVSVPAFDSDNIANPFTEITLSSSRIMINLSFTLPMPLIKSARI